jgi:hypothetical protein
VLQELLLLVIVYSVVVGRLCAVDVADMERARNVAIPKTVTGFVILSLSGGFMPWMLPIWNGRERRGS